MFLFYRERENVKCMVQTPPPAPEGGAGGTWVNCRWRLTAPAPL